MSLKKHFPVLVEQDIDGVFIVRCPVFQGCRSYGETIDEALHNIQEVIELCLEEQNLEEPANTFIGIRDIELAV
ncbi:type II toxin-antitoxin system HicB family antitoxin [Candidatus Electrothrix sp.]|uniref:type II toxin-antitoxin system HicB family antitoxin n=1 Tax=Candidatus Electrothrix sp. TaxID=2170559 RepID=UPI0040564F51